VSRHANRGRAASERRRRHLVSGSGAGAMATARIVDIDPASGRYSPAVLGRDASAGNMAAMFQFVAVLGGVESRIVDCFRHGGGVPYDAYDRFHEVMAEESAQTVVSALEHAILPLVPGLESNAASMSPTSAVARAGRSTAWPRSIRTAASTGSTCARMRSRPPPSSAILPFFGCSIKRLNGL